MFDAVNDPTHILILPTLVEGEIDKGEIVEGIGLTKSSISHQTRGLRDERIISTRKQGRNVFICIDDQHAIGLVQRGLYNEALTTFYMIDMMSTMRRIPLAFLLILLLIGLAGHIISPACCIEDTPEFCCSSEASILTAEIPQLYAVAEHVLLLPDPDISTAFCLGGKIYHPPIS